MNTQPNMIDDPYFQFPICALSFGQSVNERLDGIIAYSIFKAGDRLFDQLSREKQHQFLDEKERARQFPIGFDWEYIEQCAALYAADLMQIKFTNFNGVWEGFQRVDEYVFKFEERFGSDALVRIRADWAFKTRDGHGMTYREFCVLSAIYSAIGNKQMALVRLDSIRRRALG
jgi:hypothetical protein